MKADARFGRGASWVLFAAAAAVACSSGGASGPPTDAGVAADASQGSDAGRSDAGNTAADGGGILSGQLSGAIRVDNFGWRPADAKVAVILGHAGAQVQLRRATDNAIVGSYSASSAATDDDSADVYSTVDFSAFKTPGDYFLYLPSDDLRSYLFAIADDVYRIAGAASVKAYYYQRCNHDKVLPYATDALGGFAGHGGQWVDEACHVQDSQLGPGPGSADHGTLDLRGGWHDAGDYQKTLWGRGVPEMLFAYEMNPSAWTDGQLNIPESSNGIPDLLDEVRWELDFYVRMQLSDGHFMSSAKGHNSRTSSPPSASDEQRVYFDCTSPEGGDWSGGGVTLATATGNAVLSLAHAAIVFKAINQSAVAGGYADAAKKGWAWLDQQSQGLGDEERRLKAAAASAVFRMDSTNASAKAVADGFAWDTWDGMIANWTVTPADRIVSVGGWHYLLNAAGAAEVKAKVAAGVRVALVDRAFGQEGAYGGMFGNAQGSSGEANGWEYSWGSNRSQSSYGANLFMAARLKSAGLDTLGGSHTVQQVNDLAQKHLHYMLGLNPLNMVYLTNMAAYGGEHSSFQIFHKWFSSTGGDGDHGNAEYNGKPTWVNEPLYPYYPDDSQTSTDGPAPGLIPGGPNYYYGGSYVIPNRDRPAYAYRDFSVGCGWDGSTCRASGWELTEPMQGYQGPFVLMVSFVMGAQ